MQFHNNIWCLSQKELTEEPNAIMSVSKYKKDVTRGKMVVVRHGCYKTEALVSLSSIKDSEVREKITKKYGNPTENIHRYTLKQNITEDVNAANFFRHLYKLPDGRNLPKENITEYVNNASVLNALRYLNSDRCPFRKALGGSKASVWKNLCAEAAAIKSEIAHTLPENPHYLNRLLKKYTAGSYESLVSGKFLNQNTAKIKDNEQEAVLRKFLRHPNNFDNEQIRELYNIVAKECKWDEITAGTVANYRKKWKIETAHGQCGVSAFNNTIAMQNKRSAPLAPMSYWTMDGWVAELLYQKTEMDANGRSRTTYHNRLTIVMVLDTCMKYPLGYAIGTQESPKLIKEALRNASNHTQELFGERYKVHQMQMDRYAFKNLKPFYEGFTTHLTPARAHNPKAKVIEPYNDYLNTNYCQYFKNWGGSGVKSKKQPNAEYLNKIHSSFPDEEGCRRDLEHIMELERKKHQAKYIESFKALPSSQKIAFPIEQYLLVAGETTGFTNKLSAPGVIATIDGVKRSYDSFDIRFRQLSHNDWALKFDPANPETVLAVNAKSHNGKIVELIETERFILTEKYIQPMALVDRKHGDAEKLAAIEHFNKEMVQDITTIIEEDFRLSECVFQRNPQLEMYEKLMLVDSKGQHKDNRSDARNKALEPAKKMLEKQNAKLEIVAEKSWQEEQNAYLESKEIDYTEFLNS